MAPLRACSRALDQSTAAGTAATLGKAKRCSSHTLSLTVSTNQRSSSTSTRPLSYFRPSCCCPAFTSPVATVAAFGLADRKAYLAVCSAQLGQSWQFTCSDCRLLCPVSRTQCNYNPCISKWTKWRRVCDQCPGSNTRLPQWFIPPGFATGKQSLFKWTRSHYLALLIELL